MRSYMEPITPDASVGAFSCLRVRSADNRKHAASHVNRSINQLLNQSINQSNIQSTLHQSTDQSTNPPIRQSSNQPLHQSINRPPINQSIDHHINKSTKEPVFLPPTGTRGSSSGTGERGYNDCSRLSARKPSTDTNNIRRASVRLGSVKRLHATTSKAIYVQKQHSWLLCRGS